MPRFLIFILAAFLSLPASLLRADITVYPAANIFIPSLAIPESARAAAMGEAFTSIDNDLQSLQWNPAGLAPLKYPQMIMEANVLGNDMVQGFLSYGQKTGLGVFAGSFKGLEFGTLEHRSASGAYPKTYAYQNFEYDSGDISGMLGWSLALNKQWQVGLAGEWAHEMLPDYTADVMDGSLGIQYKPWQDWQFGASAMRLGIARAAGTGTPASFNLGASTQAVGHGLLLALDLQSPLSDSPSLKGGLEWNFRDIFYLRGGWRQRFATPFGDTLTGPTAGLGFFFGKFGNAQENWIRLDYSFVPYLDEGILTHRISFFVMFPPGLFKMPAVTQVRGPDAAKAAYEQGLKYLKDNKRIDALVSFKTSVQADPETSLAGPYVDQITKELEEVRATGQRDAEAEATMRRYFDSGTRLFQAGQLKQAIEQWEIALAVDKTNAEILKNIKIAREKLEQDTAALKQEAAQALKDGDLQLAVKDFREALKMNPDDKDAKARLAALKQRITDEIKRLHRKGIDLYLNDKLQAAVDTWRQALELDPDDPDTIKHDIDKAMKLIELRK